MVVVHVDDFLFAGPRVSLQWAQENIAKQYEVTVQDRSRQDGVGRLVCSQQYKNSGLGALLLCVFLLSSQTWVVLVWWLYGFVSLAQVMLCGIYWYLGRGVMSGRQVVVGFVGPNQA